MERYDITIQMYSADASGTQYVWEKVPAEEGDFVLYADAQATIAALQARVQDLEQWVQDQSTANLETMRHTDEMQSRAMEAEQQLTQRTAECDALKLVNDTHMKTVMKLSHVVEQRTAELEAANQHLREGEEAYHKVGELNDHLKAELERVRSLVEALPKVEGEIEVYTGKNTNQVVVTYNRGIIIGTMYGLDHAKPVAALYKRRQRMEG